MAEKERERNIYIDHHQLPLARPQLGTWPTTQACALTENQTGDLSMSRSALNPLSHASRGRKNYFSLVLPLCLLNFLHIFYTIK